MSKYKKIGGEWKQASSLHPRVADTWKDGYEGYVKIGGAWKLFLEEGDIPEDMIVFFDTPYPGGWQLCDGTNATPDLDTLYLRGAADQGVATGSNEHEHDEFLGSTGNNLQHAGSTGVFNSNKPARHAHTMNHTHPAINHEPAYYTVFPIIKDTAETLPKGAILYFSGVTVPPGWEHYDVVDDKFLKCTTADEALSGGGTHTHNFGGNSNSVSAASRSGNAYNSVPSTSHYHYINHDHAAYPNLPPHISLIPIKATEYHTRIDAGIVAFFLGDAIPDGWEYYDEAEGKFIRNNSAVDEVGGGEATHAHESDALQTGNRIGSCANNSGTSGTTYPACNHYHNMSHGHADDQTLIPRHIEMLICRKL